VSDRSVTDVGHDRAREVPVSTPPAGSPARVFRPILRVVRSPRPTRCSEITATGYGLTLGIHSRIDETVRHILGRLRVGNSYVNRSMISAVVGVQPFDGEGLSGAGPKAGGPRYLHRFATERTVSTDNHRRRRQRQPVIVAGQGVAAIFCSPE